ncbi:Aste57867_18599 [Aphanomyces stellatus]|uniref:Aste57867_18599 protein n=1 Tax=Aphanomyces stellatus TaxID=120398 RepID=A0A485LCD3_9STRA|nr:hypothetical protein As57867_018537 [Aphanomyces stellatus]VFT95334.1 Aste57867_18599 [Aphanomyces stellatus]
MDATDLVSTSNFHATLLPGTRASAEAVGDPHSTGTHSIVLLAVAQVRSCVEVSVLTSVTHSLLLYSECSLNCREEDNEDALPEHICRLQQTDLFSIVVDNDGVTLFVDPNGVAMFDAAKMQDKIRTAPQTWRAIQIHLGPMVAEFPGVVSFLSKLLAEDNISILNMSTYDTDIIYVQEDKLDQAVDCLRRKLSRGVTGLKADKDAECELRLSIDDPLDLKTVVESGQYLAVYPASMVLVRLKKDALRDSAFGLTQLVLRSQGGAHAFWCYCETGEEISLIVDEECLVAFSESAVIVSPDRWRVIKLCGRTYNFDETGVVAAMSALNSVNTQVLNISSFGANVTLVLDDALDESVASLCASLNLTRVDRLLP